MEEAAELANYLSQKDIEICLRFAPSQKRNVRAHRKTGVEFQDEQRIRCCR